MTIIFVILGILCMLLGLIGCIIPALPGPPLSYVGLLLLHFTDRFEFSSSTLFIMLALVILVTVLDYIIPMLGSKYLGASKWGSRGSLIGTIIGFFFLPWGLIVGPFLGAFIGEKWIKKDTGQAVKSGIGAVVGFLLGTVFKCILSGYMIWIFAKEIIDKL
jgi:uncharacterized protein YqgC (DUF456 family)